MCSLAVVGAADVVLRVGVECYHFLSDIDKAPASIENLTASLENTTALVETLKKHIQKHIRDSGSSVPSADLVELQPVVKQFNTAIITLQRDIKPLTLRTARYGKMRKTWASFRHVLEEKDIRKISERIESSKSSLSITLSLMEGIQEFSHTLFNKNK
ncbi:uncharacterized protein N0V89_001916 [Didymosphaeria variabile]|uniref:NACHT-NTPase and P-loop NTPases N-terminal domain-containing protein n=1 Tax=Didymosphaeria variabile TaxID=1932322 RepID=A0A9W8XRK1_9PLEO|nr:uncharacterized protein N0V89_001916 [Didymosphaeria variabile]KAJ4357341.1 hypothetical protein N0V89_001916 [Didymosphaeria variabile]